MTREASQAARHHLAIVDTIGSIPRGRVASYGEIAARAGLPGRARLVGRILSESAADAALPWFRVLRADRRIAFPEGSAAYREQVRRLAAEGVPVNAGRVDRASYGWRGTLDDVLWGPPEPKKRTSADRGRAMPPRPVGKRKSSKD
ncbi:MAG: MGMT family protein [Dokdonella sp.]|uniref:MGMT family protein n=1 Tax=Dokdonella sp. TaxID=2291710 RepID=UPI003262CCFC